MSSFLELNLSFHGLSYSHAEKNILDSVLILLIEKDDGEKPLRAQVHIIIPFRVRSTLDLSSQIPFFQPYFNEFSYQIFFLTCLNISEEKRSFALMVSTSQILFWWLKWASSISYLCNLAFVVAPPFIPLCFRHHVCTAWVREGTSSSMEGYSKARPLRIAGQSSKYLLMTAPTISLQGFIGQKPTLPFVPSWLSF